MPVPAGDPLTKVTLNLYTKDVEEMGVRFGHGWSTVVRELVHTHLIRAKHIHPLTIGDLDAYRTE